MGASESFGGLDIEVDSTNIVSGDYVTGKVHLLAKQSIETDGLTLRFTGKEVTCWVETRPETTPFPHKRTHLLLAQSFPLSPSSLILPGQYSYPFSFPTPTSLTASFSVSKGEVRAEIRYKLVAELGGQGGVGRAKKRVSVTRDINPLEGVEEVEERKFRVKSCCCVDRGELGLAAFLDKDAYFPGDSVSVDAKVNNKDSSLPIVSLKATIIREVSLRDPSSGSLYFSDLLNSSTVKVEIPPGKSLLSTQSVPLSLPIVEASGKPFSAPSVIGKLVRCRYRLELEAGVGGWGAGWNVVPKVTQEVNIFQRTDRVSEGRAPPADWNPAVMPIKKFE